MYEEEGQQQGDGLDDEIGRLAPSLELFRDRPMYSPQRSPSEWCFDQVREFSVQWEWASVPMCSPQRSPTLWCFDREQFPDQPHQRESTSYRRSEGIRFISTLDDIRKHFGRSREDAAKNLGVTVTTFKRNCRRLGINRWPNCRRLLSNATVIKQKLLNNSDHQNSPGSEPLEVVRPLQQRNNGVVLRDDTDEQNINLISWINEVLPLQDIDIGAVFGDELDQNVIHIHEINNGVVIHDDTNEQNVNLIPWINEVQPVRDTNIGAVFGNELDENVIQIHEVPTLQQRNNGVVIHNDTEEQNVNLIPINEHINVGVVFGDELDHNVIHIHEETERIETMARKGKATYVGEGNENSQVRPLQQRNDGVVIRDDTDEQNVNLIPINEVQCLQDFGNELDQNVIHIHEETERIEAMARKGKATYVSEGNENSQGYPLEERCVEVENLMDENIGQKVERAEKSCIAISHSKKKKRTDTPKRKKKKHSITLDDLQPLFGQTRAEAAKTLAVSESTFKRCCRDNGIPMWNGEGCSLVEPKPLNNSVHQNSLGFKPPVVQGEKETSALLRAREDVVKVKAIYGEATVNLWLSLESGVVELKKKVAEGLGLELGSFNVKFQDEDEDWVLIACDKDLRNCMKISSSLGNQVIRLQVTKVSNSEKSCKNCKGLKRKMS